MSQAAQCWQPWFQVWCPDTWWVHGYTCKGYGHTLCLSLFITALSPLLFPALPAAIKASFSSASNSPFDSEGSSSWPLETVNLEEVKEALDLSMPGISIDAWVGTFDQPQSAWPPCETVFAVFRCTVCSQPWIRPSCSDFFALFCLDLSQWCTCVHYKEAKESDLLWCCFDITNNLPLFDFLNTRNGLELLFWGDRLSKCTLFDLLYFYFISEMAHYLPCHLHLSWDASMVALITASKYVNCQFKFGIGHTARSVSPSSSTGVSSELTIGLYSASPKLSLWASSSSSSALSWPPSLSVSISVSAGSSMSSSSCASIPSSGTAGRCYLLSENSLEIALLECKYVHTGVLRSGRTPCALYSMSSFWSSSSLAARRCRFSISFSWANLSAFTACSWALLSSSRFCCGVHLFWMLSRMICAGLPTLSWLMAWGIEVHSSGWLLLAAGCCSWLFFGGNRNWGWGWGWGGLGG